MYPMSFKAFLMACHEEKYIDIFSEWIVTREIPALYAKPMERLLKEYYIVGGMPEVVKEYVETKDFDEVASIQDEILADYADDFSKHAPLSEIEKIRWIWESVPKQLTKENNKFVFSHVKAGKRAHELDFLYEEDGEIVLIEVKAATNTRTKSYRQFCKKYDIQNGFKFSLKNIAQNDCEGVKTLRLPLYLVWNMDYYCMR